MDYMNLKVNNEGYENAYRLWLLYQYRCELYDRTICTGEEDRDGFIMPVHNIERQWINLNANNYRKLIMDNKKLLNINDEDWDSAKKDVSRLTWSGLQREYYEKYDE